MNMALLKGKLGIGTSMHRIEEGVLESGGTGWWGPQKWEVLESGYTGQWLHWKVSELESERIGKWVHWAGDVLKSGFTGKCANGVWEHWKVDALDGCTGKWSHQIAALRIGRIEWVHCKRDVLESDSLVIGCTGK